MIEFAHVSKIYQQQSVVHNVSLKIENGETLALLGSSGSGKTTLVKMINRLVTPTQGYVELNGKNVNAYDLITLRRSIGYVFQQVGLFPHMTVSKNIAIPLKLLGYSKAKREQRVSELLALVNLDSDEYVDRYPDELSGGQQQRVGVARALAADPAYLLMDEPFGALDAITRHALQTEIIHLNKQLKKTIVFVTHDITEAFRVANRIAVIHQGELAQVGTKEDFLHRPKTAFVRDLIAQHHKTIE